jgi:alkylation response protein AidB-like acyl-CoA dehydrogenase
MAAGCVGTARAALDASLAHVTARRQFGRFIGDFSATKAHVAAMAARLYAMESLVRAVTAREALGRAIDLASIDAKVLCSEGAFALCDTAVQLHGALGFIEPVGVARMLRDCRITRIFEGANDVLLVRAGVALLAGAANEARTDARAASAPEGRYMRNAIDGLGAALAHAIAQARAEHGVRAVHRQLLLQRLARAAICRSAARATLDRGLSDGSASGLALAEHAVEMLSCEGERHLADARRAKADEARAELVSGLLYGRRGDTAGASEEAMR